MYEEKKQERIPPRPNQRLWTGLLRSLMKVTTREVKFRDPNGRMVSSLVIGNGSLHDEVADYLDNNPEPVATATEEWLTENITQPTTPVVDASLSVSGAAADSKKVGDEISDLKSAIALNSGIPTAVKNALDTLFQNVAFKNTDVYTDEIAVVHNWATAVNLISISAVFNQGTNVIYNTDSLETLKQYLTVTASYNDGTSETVIGYTLSGTLVEGTSTITVTYGGKTTTFDVVVSGRNPLIYSLYDTSFTKSADGVDTQIQLMDEDRDFTILFDGTQGGSSSDTSARYFQCLQTASPWKGIYVGSASGGGRTKTSVQWNQASQFIEYGISTEGRLRLLYSHVKGSDSVTVKWKKDTGSLETFTLSNSFLQHTGALWIGSTASNNWVGTLNKFEVYDIVIGSDVENTFFGDE